MAIPQHTIDQILDRIDIVDLIGQRVKLKKTGRTYSGCCPFHQEKSPSFHVYRDKQYFNCFGCQTNGNAISFLMKLDNRNFLDVIKDLANQANIDLPKEPQDQKRLSYKRTPQKPEVAVLAQNQPPQLSVEDELAQLNAEASYHEHDFIQHSAPLPDPQPEIVEEEGNLYKLLEGVAEFYQKQLPQSPTALQYFQKRGLTEQTIQDWRLGYAPEDWQHLEKAFPQDIEGLKKLGLIRTSDSGRDFDLLRERVIFPIRDAKGRVVGFGGRALNDEIKPKYINSPDSEVFHKNQLLYGLHEGRQNKAKDWLMVEGYMDVIALAQYGIHGAVATLGTASNTEHLNILFKQNECITLAFDGDLAGQKAARRTLEIALPLLQDGRQLKFFVLPAEHDPDSLIRREGLEYFQHLLNHAPLLSDFLFAHLTQQHNHLTPEGKSKIMGELRQLTDLLPKGAAYRYLLQQFFREKFGTFKRWQGHFSPDASLNFSMQVDTEEYVIAILIHHPHLYIYFRPLLEIFPKDTLLSHFLQIFEKVFDHLPDEPTLAQYYILGACSTYHFELHRILPHTNVQDYTPSSEQAEKLAEDFSIKLQYQCVQHQLKEMKSSPLGGLKRMAELKKQLALLEEKRSFIAS